MAISAATEQCQADGHARQLISHLRELGCVMRACGDEILILALEPGTLLALNLHHAVIQSHRDRMLLLLRAERTASLN